MRYLMVCIACFINVNLTAEQSEKAFDSSQLSAESRALLIAEMSGIKTAMENLIVPLVTQDWDNIEQLALNIEQSFVFKQQVTPAIKQELKAKLPDGFKQLDRSFHEYAASLAQSAREKNGEQTTFYYYKMLDTCQSCHSRFASQRFNKLPGGSNRQPEH